MENTQGAILAIEQQLGQPIQTVSYTSVYDMVSGLYSGTCRAMIMNGGYVSILENEAQFVDFSEKTRILCDVTVLPVPSQDPPQEPETTEPTEESTQEPTQEPTEPLSITERPFIMYISLTVSAVMGSASLPTYHMPEDRYPGDAEIIISGALQTIILRMMATHKWITS